MKIVSKYIYINHMSDCPLNFRHIPIKTKYEVDDIIKVMADSRPGPYFTWTIKDHTHV